MTTLGFCEECVKTAMHVSKKKRRGPRKSANNNVSWSLLEGPAKCDPNRSQVRPVTVANELFAVVKEHQKEGVEFIWKNCFSDCNYVDHNNAHGTDIG